MGKDDDYLYILLSTAVFRDTQHNVKNMPSQQVYGDFSIEIKKQIFS